MTSYSFWLDDEAWSLIEPMLPRNQPGARRVDDRRVLSGRFHVLRSGCRWRDCPRGYGPRKKIYNRFNRWSRRRIWQNMLDTLVAAGHLGGTVAVDSTYVRAYKQRSRIEAAFCRIKDFRRVATRYDKLAQTFRDTVARATLYMFWL